MQRYTMNCNDIRYIYIHIYTHQYVDILKCYIVKSDCHVDQTLVHFCSYKLAAVDVHAIIIWYSWILTHHIFETPAISWFSCIGNLFPSLIGFSAFPTKRLCESWGCIDQDLGQTRPPFVDQFSRKPCFLCMYLNLLIPRNIPNIHPKYGTLVLHVVWLLNDTHHRKRTFWEIHLTHPSFT